MEVSRTVLRSVFRVRNAVLSIRSPFFSAGEMIASCQAPWQRDGEPDYRKLWAARWQLVAEVLPDLETAALEAECLWESQARNLIEKLNRLVFEFSIDLEHYLCVHDAQQHEATRDDPRYQELHCVIHGPVDKSQRDVFKDKLNSATLDIETYVRAKMMSDPEKNKKR